MSNLSFTMKAIAIGVLILLLGSLTFAVIQTIGKSKWQKNAGDWKTNYYACMNAPVKEVIIHDSIIINKIVYLKPKPVTYEPAKPETNERCKATYESTYRYEEGKNFGRFRYKLDIEDCKVENLEISEVRFPKEIVIRTKQVDTCYYKEPAYRPLNHWILEANLIGNSFKKFPNFDLGISYSIQDWVKINLAGEYNAYHNEFYLKIGGGIYLDNIKGKRK